MLRLEAITAENFAACIGLEVTVEHEDHVDPVVYSLAEARLEGDAMHPFAICADDTVVGFTSLYTGEGTCQIINFLIADPYQGRGFGREAAGLCLDYFKASGVADIVSLPVHPDNVGAVRFWEKQFRKSRS